MRKLFSTLKANLSFGVTKLVLFSLGSKLSLAKFWRSQIGLAFIFFSLLPSLTEAQTRLDPDPCIPGSSPMGFPRESTFDNDNLSQIFNENRHGEGNNSERVRRSVEDFFKERPGLLSDPAEDQNFYRTQLWAFQKAAKWLKAEQTWRGSSLDEQWEELKKILDPFFHPNIIEAVREKFFAAPASGNPLSPEESEEILKTQSSYDESQQAISELILKSYPVDDEGKLILDEGGRFPSSAGDVNPDELYRIIGVQTAIDQTPLLENGIPVFSSEKPLSEARPHSVPEVALLQFFLESQLQVQHLAIQSWLKQNSKVKEIVSQMIDEFRLWERAKAPNQQPISEENLAKYIKLIDEVFQTDGPEIEDQDVRQAFIQAHLESVQNIIFHTRRSLLNLEIELAELKARKVPEPREDILEWARKKYWDWDFRIKEGKLESLPPKSDPAWLRQVDAIAKRLSPARLVYSLLEKVWRHDEEREQTYLAEMKALQGRRQRERDQQILVLGQIRDALIDQVKSLMNDADQRELNADQDLARDFIEWSWKSPDVVSVGLRLKWEDVKHSFLSLRNTLATQIPPQLEEVFKAKYYQIAFQRNIDEYRSLIHAKQIKAQARVWSDPDIHRFHQDEFVRGSLLARIVPNFKLRIKALIQNAPWPKEYKEQAEKILKELDAKERAANSGGFWNAVGDALDVVSETVSSGYDSWVKDWHGLSDQQYDLIKDDGLILAGRISYDFGIMTLATAATMGTFGPAANARVFWNGWKILKLNNGGVAGWRAAAPLLRLQGVNAAMSGSAAALGELYAAYQDDAPTLGARQRIANVLLNTNRGMRDSALFMASIAGIGRVVGVLTQSPRATSWTTFVFDIAEALPNMPDALRRISDAGDQADPRALWAAVGLLAVEAFDLGGDVILSGVAKNVSAKVQEDLFSRRIKENFPKLDSTQQTQLLDQFRQLRGDPKARAKLTNYFKNVEKSAKEMIDALKEKNIELNSPEGGAYLLLALTMTNQEFSVPDLMAFIDRNTSQSFTVAYMAALVDKAKQANHSIRGPPLNSSQLRAIVEAHLVGQGQLGNDGLPAGITVQADGSLASNFTIAQLREKSRLLDAVGLNQAQRRALMEAGVVGLAAVSIFSNSAAAQLEIKLAELETAVEDRMEDLEVDLIEAAKRQISKKRNQNGNTAKSDGKDQPTIDPPAHFQPSIDALADLRTSKAIDALAEIANDPDPTVAQAAIDALASTNTKEAIDALGDIAKSSNTNVAQAAIDALASTNTTEARAVLLKIIRSNSPQAGAAAEALRRMTANSGSAGPTSSAAKAAEPASSARELTAEQIIEWADKYELNGDDSLNWLKGFRGLSDLKKALPQYKHDTQSGKFDAFFQDPRVSGLDLWVEKLATQIGEPKATIRMLQELDAVEAVLNNSPISKNITRIEFSEESREKSYTFDLYAVLRDGSRFKIEIKQPEAGDGVPTQTLRRSFKKKIRKAIEDETARPQPGTLTLVILIQAPNGIETNGRPFKKNVIPLMNEQNGQHPTQVWIQPNLGSVTQFVLEAKK